VKINIVGKGELFAGREVGLHYAHRQKAGSKDIGIALSAGEGGSQLLEAHIGASGIRTSCVRLDMLPLSAERL
jgi:hypothetical protein